MSGPGDATSPPAGPGPEAVGSDAGYTRVAPQVIRDGARVIGFLTVSGKRRPVPLTELLERLAQGLAAFGNKDVAFIPTWNEWVPIGDAPSGADGAHLMSVREVHPRVIRVTPAACQESLAAAQALTRTLTILSKDFAQVLVNLDGYAPAGRAPTATELVETVGLMVATRRARLRDVSAIADQIPASKHLGAVLLG